MYNNVSLVYVPGNVMSIVDDSIDLYVIFWSVVKSQLKTLEDIDTTDNRTNVLDVNIMYFIFKKVVSAPLMAPALVGTTVPTEPRQRQSTDVQMERIMMLRDSMRKPSVKTAGKVRW